MLKSLKKVVNKKLFKMMKESIRLGCSLMVFFYHMSSFFLFSIFKLFKASLFVLCSFFLMLLLNLKPILGSFFTLFIQLQQSSSKVFKVPYASFMKILMSLNIFFISFVSVNILLMFTGCLLLVQILLSFFIYMLSKTPTTFCYTQTSYKDKAFPLNTLKENPDYKMFKKDLLGSKVNWFLYSEEKSEVAMKSKKLFLKEGEKFFKNPGWSSIYSGLYYQKWSISFWTENMCFFMKKGFKLQQGGYYINMKECLMGSNFLETTFDFQNIFSNNLSEQHMMFGSEVFKTYEGEKIDKEISSFTVVLSFLQAYLVFFYCPEEELFKSDFFEESFPFYNTVKGKNTSKDGGVVDFFNPLLGGPENSFNPDEMKDELSKVVMEFFFLELYYFVYLQSGSNYSL